MNWNQHSECEGKHAFLSPSKWRWINKDIDDIVDEFKGSQHAQALGTALHELAADLIKIKMKLNKNDRHLVIYHLIKSGIPQYAIRLDDYMMNLMAYVNDAISFRMDPEVTLYVNNDCFGTADAIYAKDNILRIHDLKTGTTPAHMEQLLIYAALYCLEYKKEPRKLDCELRIYQCEEISVLKPEPEDIFQIMEKIMHTAPVLHDVRRKGE